MEDRIYNRWPVLQREPQNSEAVIKTLREESERQEDLFGALELNNLQRFHPL